jgi:hypothetical protein
MKNNLSYYPRKVEWHRHPKIKLLKVTHGLAGDSNFGTLCDCIAEAEGCWLDLRRPFIKAAVAEILKMDFPQLDEFVSFLCGPCELLIEKDGCISTETAQETLIEVMKDRETARDRYNKRRDKGENNNSSPEVSQSSSDGSSKINTKETKVNKTKE